MPTELLEKILSSLSPRDLYATSLTSKKMNIEVIKAANFNEIYFIHQFICKILENLNTENFEHEKNFLIYIANNITIEKHTSLFSLKSYIWDLKNNLIEVIKRLDETTANALRDQIEAPNFMKDVFELAAFARRINSGNLITDLSEKQFTFDKIAADLSSFLVNSPDIHTVDIVVNIGMLIIDDQIRRKFFTDIFIKLKENNINKAIALAELIPDKHRAGYFFLQICTDLIKNNNLEKARRIAMLNPDELNKSCSLKDVSLAYLNTGDKTTATEIANFISLGRLRETTLEKIEAIEQP